MSKLYDLDDVRNTAKVIPKWPKNGHFALFYFLKNSLRFEQNFYGRSTPNGRLGSYVSNDIKIVFLGSEKHR